MDLSKYKRIDLTFKSGFILGAISLIFSFAAMFLFIAIQGAIWGSNILPTKPGIFIVILLVEILVLGPVHEYIHALTYIKMGKFSKNAVKYKCNLPISLSVHYKEITTVRVRRWSALMPTIILCGITLIIGLGFNHFSQTLMAGALLGSGGSDIYNWLKLRKYSDDCLVEDLENIAGCVVYAPKE